MQAPLLPSIAATSSSSASILSSAPPGSGGSDVGAAVAAAPLIGKVWFLTAATNPLGFAVARKVLQTNKEDFIAVGCTREEFEVLRKNDKTNRGKAIDKEEKKNTKKDDDGGGSGGGNSSNDNENDDNNADNETIGEDKDEEVDRKVDIDDQIESIDLQLLKNWGGERCLIVPLDLVYIPLPPLVPYFCCGLQFDSPPLFMHDFFVFTNVKEKQEPIIMSNLSGRSSQ